MKFSIVAGITFSLCCTVAAAANDRLTLAGPPRPAFVYVGPKDDAGWQQAIDRAREKIEGKLNIEIPYAEKIPRVTAEVTVAAEGFIKQGYNIIVGDSAGYAEAFRSLAEKYPNTAFINIGGDIVGRQQPPNLKSVYGRSYESQYLCGLVAGATSKSGKLGFLAAGPSSVANWEINGYTSGARSVKPDAIVHVKFVGSPSSEKERVGASTLIDHGADVIGQSIDGPTPLIVARERGVFATGHAVDLHEQAPETVLCSSIWVWESYLVPEIKKIAAGGWMAGPADSLLGMTRGGTDIACCSKAVAKETIYKLVAERDGIIISEKQIFSGAILDRDGKERVPVGGVLSDADLLTMNWYVEGVVIDRD